MSVTVLNESTLSRRLNMIYETKLLADVEFLVGKEQVSIKAHKLILSVVSEVFQAMLYRPLSGTFPIEIAQIAIPDVEPNAFKVLLQYAYNDQIELSTVKDALDCIYAARKYLVGDLTEKCVSYLKVNKTVDNICEIYKIASMIDHEGLKTNCENFVLANLKVVLNSDGFLCLTSDIVLKVAEKMSNKVDPVLMFDSLIKWSKSQLEACAVDSPAGLRERMNQFLPHIPFLAMKPASFCQTVVSTGLLADHEVVPIILAFHNVVSRPLPSWCNSQTKIEEVIECGAIAPRKRGSRSSSLVLRKRKNSRS